MAYVSTQGLSVWRSDYSETSQVVSYLLKDVGRLNVLAKGVKRSSKTRPASPVDLLELDEVVILKKPAGRLSILAEHRQLESFRGVRRDLKPAWAAQYLAEILRTVAQEEHPEPELYRRSVEYLGSLARGGPVKALVTALELTVLEQCGYMPDLSSCDTCGRELKSGARFSLVGSEVVLRCTSCPSPVGGAVTVVRPGSLSPAKMLVTMEMHSVGRIRLDTGMLTELSALSRAMLRHVLGREFRMWRYV